jgi:hypothetical protein
MNIDYDTLQKIKNLDLGRNMDWEPFGNNTCSDYVDSIYYEDGKYGITVFVEPCGDITKWGNSINEVLDWWIEVFERQPEDWDYCKAGWYLDELAERGLPENPDLVWPIEIESKEWQRESKKDYLKLEEDIKEVI